MKIIQSLAVMCVLLSYTSSVEAGFFNGKAKPAGCCDNARCEPCSYTCCPEVKTVKVKKYCWEVECKPVCIPKVNCPLFSFFRKDNCDPCTELDACGRPLSSLCAEVRTVKKLKKVDYECEKCVVEWKVQCTTPGCGKCCDGFGVPGSCCQVK